MSTVQVGVNLPTSAAPGADPVGDARLAEELGFDFVSSSDHPCGTAPTFETWTMLTWAAAATTRIRIATRVLGVPYRAPAMVAKMAETLHRLSGGRLILGLGGGYSDEEFRAFGLRIPTPREKVDGLAEAIAIIRGLWSESGYTYTGELFHTESADIEPKPESPIPIWLGTYGPRALTLTGRVADGWIPSHGYWPADEIGGIRDRVVAAAEAAGRDPAQLTYAYNVQVFLGDRDDDPNVIAGSPGEVVEQLAEFVGLGFRTLNLMPQGPDPRKQVEQLGVDVLPALHALV